MLDNLVARECLTENRLITCILPSGRGHGVVERLKTERGILSANYYRARGLGYSSHFRSSFTESSERDVVVVLIPTADADATFAYLYDITGIGQPHHGMMYQQKAGCATIYSLPPELSEHAGM
jgi:hypothetical protein